MVQAQNYSCFPLRFEKKEVIPKLETHNRQSKYFIPLKSLRLSKSYHSSLSNCYTLPNLTLPIYPIVSSYETNALHTKPPHSALSNHYTLPNLTIPDSRIVTLYQTSPFRPFKLLRLTKLYHSCLSNRYALPNLTLTPS